MPIPMNYLLMSCHCTCYHKHICTCRSGLLGHIWWLLCSCSRHWTGYLKSWPLLSMLIKDIFLMSIFNIHLDQWCNNKICLCPQGWMVGWGEFQWLKKKCTSLQIIFVQDWHSTHYYIAKFQCLGSDTRHSE